MDIHLLLFITKKYANICAKNLINNTQIHSCGTYMWLCKFRIMNITFALMNAC